MQQRTHRRQIDPVMLEIATGDIVAEDAILVIE